MVRSLAEMPIIASTAIVAATSAAIVAVALYVMKGRTRWLVSTVVPLLVAIVAYLLTTWRDSSVAATHYDAFELVPLILWASCGLMTCLPIAALRDIARRKDANHV
jgi:hypothetical protein